MQTVNEDRYRIIAELRWGHELLPIWGNDMGLNTIVVSRFDETLNIVDFLNKLLRVEYFDCYFNILINYNNKLETGSIFELNYPDIPMAHSPIDRKIYEGTDYSDDELVAALLGEYLKRSKGIREGVAEWGKTVGEWLEGNREK